MGIGFRNENLGEGQGRGMGGNNQRGFSRGGCPFRD